jgi:thioesterase domain-containing protein
VQGRLHNVMRRFHGAVDDDIFTPPAVLDPEMNERLRRVATGLFHARDKYRPARRAKCDVLLLKASIPFDWSGSTTDPLYGWRDFVSGQIDTAVIPGEHLQLFRSENDPLMADFLSARLAELRERDEA